MKRTHKPYQEYFLVAKNSTTLATDGSALFTDNAINLTDGQLGILDVSDNTFVTGSNTVSQVPAIKLLAGTPTSADFSKNYGWHIGEVKPFLVNLASQSFDH